MRIRSCLVLFTFMIIASGALQAQWNPTGATATVPIYRTGSVGVGLTSAGPNMLCVKNASSMDGVSVDGTNPALILRNSSALGYFGLVTVAGTFFTNTAVNDIILRSESGKIHIGKGSALAGVTIDGGYVGIGNTAPTIPLNVVSTNNNATADSEAVSETDLTVSPNGDQTIYATRVAQYGLTKVPSTSTHAVGEVRGGGADADNFGSGSINVVRGHVAWGYNAASASIGSIYGAGAYTESDAGTVGQLISLHSYGNITGGTVTSQYGMYLEGHHTGGSLSNQFGIYDVVDGATATNRYGLYLHAGTPAATNDYAVYQDTSTSRNYFAGAVGIGTSNPGAGYALDVNGAIHSSGAITGATVYANYQDVAEWVPATPDAFEPGTVVILNPAKGNSVMASAAAYDTTVAGVVSAHPGVVLGSAGEGKAQIATTGRVKVKVDASRGAIRVGDLLVTSGVAGTAMRSVPVDIGGITLHRPGTIIGKALEALPSGTGEILVLLSLQ